MVQVDTLNEALRIAALDIAGAAGDQLLSDDEEEESGDISPGNAAASLEVKARNESQRASGTVVVSADGSYSLS